MNDTTEREEFPEHWSWISLGKLGEWGSGGTPKSDNDAYYGGDIPWLKIGDLNNGVVAESEEKITQKGLQESSAKLIPENALLVAMYGSIGKLGITGVQCASNQAIAYCIPDTESVSLKYLFWALRHHQTDLIESGKGGVQKNISQTVLKNFEIPLPPLPEQRRIVAKIEELFSNLDAGRADLQAAGQQLERYRLSVLQAAVEGRLTADWRRTHDPEPADQLLERILEERREQWEEDYRAKYEKKGKELPKYWKNRYSPPDEPDLPDDLHEVPESWTWTSIGYMCDMTSGGTPKRSDDSYWGEDIPWLKSGELNDGLVTGAEERITEKGLDESSTNIFPSGTLLIALYGATTGKLGILDFPSATNQAVCGLFVTESLNTKYLFWYLRQFRPELLSKRFGGAQKNISQTILKQVPVPLPPLAEQKQIVDEVERLLSVAEDASATANREETRAERLRQSILKQAFSGRLVPHDEDATPPSIDGTASEASDSDASDGSDSDVEDLLGSTDPDKQIEMDL